MQSFLIFFCHSIIKSKKRKLRRQEEYIILMEIIKELGGVIRRLMKNTEANYKMNFSLCIYSNSIILKFYSFHLNSLSSNVNQQNPAYFFQTAEQQHFEVFKQVFDLKISRSFCKLCMEFLFDKVIRLKINSLTYVTKLCYFVFY